MSGNLTTDDPLPLWTRRPAQPGLVLVWTAGRPTCQRFPFPDSKQRLQIGREAGDVLLPNDTRVSRAHADVFFDDGDVVIRDLGSRNGVFLNGVRVEGTAVARLFPRPGGDGAAGSPTSRRGRTTSKTGC